MSSFKDLRVVDNFYQTSLFFPMPTVLVSTLTEDGKTTVGPYSLVQPYYVAGKDYYAMLLNCRNSSNTAQNILRTGKCAINFVTDERKYFKEVVRLGWPGDTPEEKMKDCKFTFEPGIADTSEGKRPEVVKESFQVIECTWMKDLDNAGDCKPGQLDGYEGPYHDFNGITSKFGATFILRVDKILMKEKYYNAIVNGVRAKDFPRVPVDYGYRDSKNFWYARFTKAIPELLPIRATTVDSVKYAADRIDDKIKFTDEACAMLVNVPRIFLPTALRGCVAWARERNITLITADHMKEINDKRAKEKKR
ncbi:MAG: flavin reductase [Lachnospiraceae bacterium]|nr:flavin reductase [Lachnospiraceae bacterium]